MCKHNKGTARVEKQTLQTIFVSDTKFNSALSYMLNLFDYFKYVLDPISHFWKHAYDNWDERSEMTLGGI